LVEEFKKDDLVLVKNRASGSLESKLVGPFKFVGYKDRDKYAVWLENDSGDVFDCAVTHLVPLREH
jgi:hypothetical protein